MPKPMAMLDSPGSSIHRRADAEQERYCECANLRDIMPDCLGWQPNRDPQKLLNDSSEETHRRLTEAHDDSLICNSRVYKISIFVGSLGTLCCSSSLRYSLIQDCRLKLTPPTPVTIRRRQGLRVMVLIRQG